MIESKPPISEVIPKPFKPKFRYLKPREHLTTVIAVQCRDGIILCADSQETSDLGILGTKENVSKIRPVSHHGQLDRYCMLGCAGVSNYIDLFRRHVGEAFLNRGDNSYFEALDRAVLNYTVYVTTRSNQMGGLSLRGREFPSAIFVGYEPTDDKTRVYAIDPPHPPNELSEPYRMAIGTGGLYASLLFGMAEKLMSKVGFDWSNLSTKLVSQFCYMVLGRVISYDRDSGMDTRFYRVDKTGYSSLSDEQIFPGHGEREEYRLTIFLRTLRDELPKEKMLKLLSTYNLSELLAGVFKPEEIF
jgi:20S proteasome alpha/beta subunit